MASAVIVGWFEDELRREVLLALFIPAVVYMADAVGTQTETLVIRGMAAGIPIREVFVRELATGVIRRLDRRSVLSVRLRGLGRGRRRGAVALALGVSCSIATLVAMVLPYVLARLGRDPAYGSGPLATVIQDLLSVIAIYFAVATARASTNAPPRVQASSRRPEDRLANLDAGEGNEREGKRHAELGRPAGPSRAGHSAPGRTARRQQKGRDDDAADEVEVARCLPRRPDR